jgi:hypothetical protein
VSIEHPHLRIGEDTTSGIEHCSEDPPLPTPQAVAAFVGRFYVCHHCEEAGLERRETDPGAGAARFVLGAGRLLLSSCTVCDLGGECRRRAAEELQRQVDRDRIPWVLPVRLMVQLCSRPRCRRLWHHLGGPLPFVSLGDPHDSMPHRRWHPCPWCVGEDLEGASVDHETFRRTLADLGEWESEIGRR